MAVGQTLLIPSPMTVAQSLLALSGTGAFWLITLLSLGRILLGLVLGTFLGVGCAIACHRSTLLGQLLAPAIRVIRATPVVSFILLILLWSKRGMVPVYIAMLMVLPVIWASTMRGLGETDYKLLELATVYRFSPLKTARLVYLPSVLPYFTSALTTALGLSWKSGVAAEVLCRPLQAIGTEINNTKLYLDTPGLFAWTIVIVVLSLLLELVITRLIGRFAGGDAHAGV